MTENSQTARRHRDGFWVGIALVGIGLLVLLDRTGTLGPHHAHDFWPLLLVLVGAVYLTHKKPGYRAGSLLMIAAGFFLLLGTLGIIHLMWHLVWPAAIVIVGLYLIYATKRKRVLQSAAETGTAAPRLLGRVLLASKREQILSGEFEGGEVSAVLGSYEIDLTRAVLREGRGDLWAHVMMGSVQVRIPEGWKVEILGDTLLGAVEDKTLHRPNGEEPVPHLAIHASCVLGSVEIRN